MPPAVVAITPPDGAEGVPSTIQSVSISSSKSMDPETLDRNIFLTDPAGNRIGACAGIGADVYVITVCGSNLEPSTTYTIHVWEQSRTGRVERWLQTSQAFSRRAHLAKLSRRHAIGTFAQRG
jgi:hypothetical protein